MSMIDPLFSFFIICSWKQEDMFLYIVSIFCVYSQTGFVQVSRVFLSLSCKTNTCAGWDLYDSKQYRCRPSALPQSTQNESSSEGLLSSHCIWNSRHPFIALQGCQAMVFLHVCVWMLQFNVSTNTAASSGLPFSPEMEDIPKVNCPDYTCTGGVIVWWIWLANTLH